MGRNLVGFAFVLACILPLVFTQILRPSDRQCRPSIFYRPRSCGNFVGQDCFRRGCCFRPFFFSPRRGRCNMPARGVIGLPYYRLPESELNEINPNPPFTHVVVGGVSGYPGSTIRVTCQVGPSAGFGGQFGQGRQGVAPCGPRNLNNNPSECRRAACCWSRENQCYRPVFTVVRLRNRCEPGFRNPPKCEDIDECTYNVTTRCQNNGVCTNLINSYSCQCEGTITGTDCTEVCRDPPVVANSTNTYNGVPLNTNGTVTYTCDTGFRLVGNAQVTCQATQTYTNPPTCVRACVASDSSPPRAPNVLFSPSRPDYIAGEIVNYTCADGVTLDPNVATNECVNGAWIRPSPNCFSCGQPPLPFPSGSGFITAPSGNNLYMVGDVVIYQCLAGAVLVGALNNTCLATGNWSEAQPVCSSTACPFFLPVGNGSISPAIATQSALPINSIVTVNCNSGFYISPSTPLGTGSANFTCLQANNAPPQYFPTLAPQCLRGCFFPTTNLPNNATFVPDENFSGLIPNQGFLFIFCVAGFTRSGPATHTCQAENSPQFPTLTSTPTACQPNCPLVSSLSAQYPANSNLVSVNQSPDAANTMPVGTVATFNCSAGYLLIGTNTITCESTGNYTAFNFNCVPSCANSPVNLSPTTVTLTALSTNGVTPSNPPFQEGDRFFYACQNPDAFTLNTTANITTCQSNMMFSLDASPPTCNQVACATPLLVGNATISPSMTSYSTSAMVTYSCNTNYVLSGSSVSTCMVDFSWSLDTNLPQCLRTCGDPPTAGSLTNSLSMGSQIGSLYVQDNVVDYSCPTGQISMNASAICLDSGNWNVTASSLPSCNPNCDIAQAPTPPSDGASFVLGSPPYSAGESIVYSCNNPTNEIIPSVVTCQISGSWLPSTIGSCVQTLCGQPSVTSNNNAVLSPQNPTYSVGTMLTYSCSSGFGATTPAVTLCQQNFTWTLDSNPPSCSRVCPSPPTTPSAASSTPATNGSVTFFEGDIISYMCDAATQSIPSDSVALCMNTGVFNVTTIPSCETVRCGLPSSIDNGTIDTGNSMTFESGVTLTYTCNSGFSSRNSLDTMCRNSDFMFSLDATPPMCLEVCPTPPSVTNAMIASPMSAYLSGDQISYQCNGTLVFANNSVVRESTCQFNGGTTVTWTLDAPNLPVCYCDAASFPQSNGTQLSFSNPIAIGEVVSYVCEAGQFLRGSESNQCNSTGAWINDPPTCENVCPSSPPAIANGGLASSQTHTAPYFTGEQITYQCNNGFTASETANLINRCMAGSTTPAWERNTDDLSTVCRPSVNIVLLVSATSIGTCTVGQPVVQGQRDFVTGFQSAWGNNAITQGGSQIAVGITQGTQFTTISGFSDTDAQRTAAINNFNVGNCGTFSLNGFVGGAQRDLAGIDSSLPIYYIILFNAQTWSDGDRTTAISDFSSATVPINTVVFPIAVTASTPNDLVTFLNTYYTMNDSNLQSVRPGLYVDATMSGSTTTSVVNSIVSHCQTNNC